METTLHPPGFHELSVNVIGCVVQRSLSSRDRSGGGRVAGYYCNDQLQTRSILPNCSTTKEHTTSNAANLSNSRQAPVGQATRVTPTKHRDTKQYKLSGRRKSKVQTGSTTMTERRREYYRMKQQRYRDRQRQCEEELESSTRQLTEEINQLKRHRDQLTFQAPRNLTIWIVATEYLRIFSRGVFTRDDINPNDLALLDATMARDVLVEPTSGEDALIRNWSLVTQWFPDVLVQLKQLKQLTKNSLIASITVSFTISAAAMQGAFPHLLNAREGSRCAQIAERVWDQHLVLQGSVCFDWDDKSKQVIRLHHQVDMMSVMLQMLGNLEDVALVFNGAHVTPECAVSSAL
ncbi:hypothetical protein F441_18483, partial [Phytophthora nicotianae CJ01A1]